MDNQYVIVLKEARRRIENKSSDYVCCAITDAVFYYDSKGVDFSTYGQIIRANIRHWLDGHNTYERWLEDKHGIRTEDSFESKEGAEKTRLSRLAWIDSMIEYYKEKK